jgi:hypothetical protein
MRQLTIRFSGATINQIRQAATEKDVPQPQLSGKPSSRLSPAARRSSSASPATLGQIQSDLARIHRVQQTSFALVDTFAKAVLTGLPEQSSASVVGGKNVMSAF